MNKDEYGDFVLRYKGCGACFPMYHTLSRFEKMWFTAIQKDVAELQKENARLKEINTHTLSQLNLDNGELIIENEKLKKENAELQHQLTHRNCVDCSNHSSKLKMRTLELEKENAELKSIAEFQQSSNMSRHFENKKLKEGLAVGSTFNKALNSMNKNLIEKSDKYRNMVFDKDEQLTKAKEIIKELYEGLDKLYLSGLSDKQIAFIERLQDKTEQFLSDIKESE